jgi:hypothetical protein
MLTLFQKAKALLAKQFTLTELVKSATSYLGLTAKSFQHL